MLINCTAYRQGIKLNSIELNEISFYLSQPDCIVWVALNNPSDSEISEVQTRLKLPELAIEDAKHGHQRPKIEEYGECVFSVVKIPYIQNDELLIGEVSVFIGINYVLSVRKDYPKTLSNIRERLESDPELLKLGSGVIFYALIDEIVDLYFPIIYTLELELDQLEENIFNEHASHKLVRQLYNLKTKVLSLKHMVAPLLSDLSKPQGETSSRVFSGMHNYLRDVSDHLSRILTSIESIIETTNMAMGANLSLIAIEDSKVNKKLAAWAGIFAIATAFVGIWGMNFRLMPELDWKWGYPGALAFIALICGFLYYRFKKSGWL